MEALVLPKNRGLLQPGGGRGSGTGVWTVSPGPAGGVGLGPEGAPGVPTPVSCTACSVSTAVRLDLQAHTWFLSNQLSVKRLLHS